MSHLTARTAVTGLLALALVAEAAPAAAQRAPRPPTIEVVRPAELSLLPGQKTDLDLHGRRLNQARGVLIERNRRIVNDVIGRLRCVSNQTCLLRLAARRNARAARYRVFLAAADERPLLELPLLLSVVVPPRGEQPDRVVTLEGEPGVSVQRSCEDGNPSTDIALLEPVANGGLVVGTDLTWQRSEHEVCGTGANKRYALAICNSPAGECAPFQGLYRVDITIDPDYIGNGRYTVVQADLDTIAERGGIVEGDSAYWQMRYQYDTTSTVRGELTPKRPLTFGIADEVEPEPDPDPGCPTCPLAPVLFQPNAGSVIDAVNRTFSWSETPGAVSWEVCFLLPPGTNCVRQLRRNGTSLSGLGFEEFEEFGLIGREFQWQVIACNAAGDCSPPSARRTNFAPTAPAERVYPPHRAEASAPRTFIWRAVDGADFYRLIVGHGGAPNHRQRWVETTETSYAFTADDLAAIGSPATGTSTWWVRPCWEPGGGTDPVCADSVFAPIETVNVNFVKFRTSPSDPGEVSFDAFIDAFRAGSCTRCHAVRATGGGFPAGHPGVAGDPADAANCIGCHNDNLLPQFADNLAVQWHGAPPNTDLRGLNDAQLCARAGNSGGVASTPGDHLSRDPLILWAVDGGQLPFNAGNTDEAWPGTLQEWRRLVRDWDAAGRPCERP